MAKHNITGAKGEETAVEYLKKKSYQILEKSWRFKHKEIDIIAKDNECIVFIEVKTRTDDYWGNPEEFVSKSKQKLIIQAAEAYIEEKDYDGESRFDIIAITTKDHNSKIEHITDAFYPGL